MIFFDERRNTITLSTAATTYQMKVDSTGVLLHTYYGPRLRGGDLSNRIVHEDRGFSPNPYEVGKDRTYSLDTLPQEYSSCGVGDFRVPSVEATCGKGSRTVDLRYVGHTVREGKYALEGLPAFYDEGVTAQTLSVELRDSCTGLEVELLYGVLEEYDLITRAVRVRNGGESPMELERVSSVCLDFPAGEHDLITLGGAYAREREPVRMPLTQGVHTVGSVRGTSSHQQNPFVVLCDHETTEDAGRCWGVALVYSGSFQANTEYTQFHA
jgi:alpha-galactosidase